MDSDNNLRLKASYLSGQISAGCGTCGGGEGWTCIEDGGGEGICPQSRSGICGIVQYCTTHVTKEEKKSRRAEERGGGVGGAKGEWSRWSAPA